MALIECGECGKMISDKAASCPNCGAPVEKKYVCEDCGAIVSEAKMACPKCGRPNPHYQTENVEQQGFTQSQQQVFTQQPQQQAFVQQPQLQPYMQQSQNAFRQPSPEEMKSRVNRFLIRNKDMLPELEINNVRHFLEQLDQNQMNVIEGLQFQQPMTVWIVSFFLGFLGIDRFMIGDTMSGVIKLITGGACGFWWLIDLFLISGETKRANQKKIKDAQHFL